LRFFSSEEVSGLEVALDLKPVIIDFLMTKLQGQKTREKMKALKNQLTSVRTRQDKRQDIKYRNLKSAQ
jgi:hypothetical protein